MKENKPWYKKWWAITLFIIIGLLIIGSLIPDNKTSPNTQRSSPQPETHNAIAVVSPELTGLPDLNIEKDDLSFMENPIGEGTFVYVPQTDFYGVERLFLWMVIDNEAYAINGATKDLTPNLGFPRDANEEIWKKTGLNKYDASEAVGIVFRGEIPSKNNPETEQITNQQYTQKEISSFSKSLTDTSEDCEGGSCKDAIDIISASLDYKKGSANVVIELKGEVPRASELKEIEDENSLTWPEIYQYVLSVKIDGEWVDVLFGDVRADTKESAGGCGPIYIIRDNMGNCADSQVKFLTENNQVTISGPLNVEISDFRIKTLYESTVDISITDVAEG